MNTVSELLYYRFSTHPERPAVFFGGKIYTYSDIWFSALSTAEYLKGKGLRKGDRFSVLDFNSMESVHLLNASSIIGSVPVYLNWRLAEPELIQIIEDSGSLFLLFGKGFKETALKISQKKHIVCIPIEESVLVKKGSLRQSESETGPNDTFVQLYTSGTSGLPKGVPLSNDNLLSVVKSLGLELPGFGADSVNLVCAPFFHIGGVGYYLLGIHSGALNILLPKFDPAQVRDVLIEKKVTNALLVPAMIKSLLSLPGMEDTEFPFLRNIQYGGSPVSDAVLEKANQIFRCSFTRAYGLTETSGIASLLRFDENMNYFNDKNNEKYIKRMKSVGKPSPEMEICIKNEQGFICAFEEAGEVCIRGKYLFSGYWNKSDVNSASFDSDGFFHTGDIGKMDSEGYLFLLDRKTDMILSKAENIYPAEIENHLSDHKSIYDSAVAGIPDAEFGEVPAAFIVLKKGEQLNLESLRDFLSGRIASYKIPKKLYIVEAIPRNPSGKILRRELRDSVLQGAVLEQT